MERTVENPKRVVILGAGFGGMYAYLELHKRIHTEGLNLEIILISENDHFLFVPLLHEVSTGNLLPSSVRQSVRTVPQCCLHDYIPGRVHGIDFDTKEVYYRYAQVEDESADQAEQISYDYLIVALGSDTAFYGVPGAEEHTLVLKSLEDARRIKNTILRRFEEAQLMEDEREIERHLTFLIVGGGPTGVELVGEIADLVNNELQSAYPMHASKARIIVADEDDLLVKEMGPWFSEEARRILKKKGVEFRFNARVSAVDENGAQAGDHRIDANTVIWVAGVRAQELELHAKKTITRNDRTRRLSVAPTLQLPSYSEVFVVGDCASVIEQETDQPYPMRAQFAIREGKHAAKNISRLLANEPLKPFTFSDVGFLLSLGNGGALAELYGIKFKGLFAWVLYRGAWIYKLLGFRAKVRTAVEWTLNYFSPRDISEL